MESNYINVDSKGYGKIYKAVTRNPELPLIAKAIYAYLCSYAGNGTTAFPSRNQITNDLRINKDTFTTHMNTLIAQGFIARQRTTTNNLYSIVQQIAKENNTTIEKSNTDYLVFDDIKSKGYGTIPKLAVRDKRLSAQSKAIYAYFCSFAGSGNTAFPRQATILRELKISKNTYYKHYKALLEYGYLSVTQEKVDGKFTVAVYRIHDSIEQWENEAMSEKVGHGKNPATKGTETPMSEKLVSEEPGTEEVISEKMGYSNFGRTNNTNSSYNKHIYNKQVNDNHNHKDVENTPTLPKIKRWMCYEQLQEGQNEIENVIGWLTVSGTNIDSMIVHNPDKENGFYTNHDFNGNPSKDGAYFADKRCDFTTPTLEGISQNIALFGHSWDEDPDGQLFSQLKRFKESEFAKNHPYIYFSTQVEDMVWEVFAVYNISVNQPYIIPDLPWESLKEVLDIAYDASLFDYGIRLTESDKILTLSTCSFDVPGKEPLPLDRIPDYRLVVMARLVSQDEKIKETVTFTKNNSPLKPDDMPIIYSHHADVVQFNGTLYRNLTKQSNLLFKKGVFLTCLNIYEQN